MKNQFPSLITADTQAGLVLAHNLATQLHVQMDAASDKVPRPGGMNYRLPASAPKEITAGILFYAIAAANQGWTVKN